MEKDRGVGTQELIDGLKRVDGILHRRYWHSVKFKEKPAAFMLMSKLRRACAMGSEDGVRVSELAADFGMTSPAITQMVTVLEERGLVGRRMDPEDRRAVLVYLTPQGKARIKDLYSALDDVLQGLVEHIGQERSRLFLELLNEVAEYFESRSPEGPRRGESC